MLVQTIADPFLIYKLNVPMNLDKYAYYVFGNRVSSILSISLQRYKT